MKLIVINSNSSGNAYILENDQEALLIECGVRFERIKQALNFNFKKVVGCIITHEHLDHCKSVWEVLAAGVNVHTTYLTHIAMGTDRHHRAKQVLHETAFSCGSFRIMPFRINHDCADPVGYMINHEETGNILFLTDSYYSDYTFKDLNNIIIEANYCQSILDKRLEDGVNPKFLRDRVLSSHMSLATCKEFLKANDLAGVNNIVLIHLSDGNSDAARFKKEVQEVSGKPVFVADAGMAIEFNKTPF